MKQAMAVPHSHLQFLTVRNRVSFRYSRIRILILALILNLLIGKNLAELYHCNLRKDYGIRLFLRLSYNRH